MAARLASEDPASAAIAGEAAARLYDLRVVRARIEDHAWNFTRFLVLGPQPVGPTGADKTSLIVAAEHRPGGLFDVLAPLAEGGLNLSKIESRPRREHPFEYLFFVGSRGAPIARGRCPRRRRPGRSASPGVLPQGPRQLSARRAPPRPPRERDMSLVPPHIESLKPYVPGKPIEETERELGITGVAKLASNENPLGPGQKADRGGARGGRPGSPLPRRGVLLPQAAISPRSSEVRTEELVVGNGSNELLELLVRTFLRPRGTVAEGDDEAIISEGSFIVYKLALQAHGVNAVSVPMKDRTFDLDAMADAVTERTRMVFVANPNNPTGTWVDRKTLGRFLSRLPEQVIVVLDEAYFEYVTEDDYPDGLHFRESHPNLVVLRTFSKIHGLAGMRVGYGVMPAQLADYVNRVRAPFNVNSLGQVAALAALDDTEHVRRSRKLNAEGLAYFMAALPEVGVTVTPSVANFVLADFGRPGTEVFEACLREGVIIRPMAGYGFLESARISVGLPEENARVVRALKKVLGG